jgi:hypothetical protein
LNWSVSTPLTHSATLVKPRARNWRAIASVPTRHAAAGRWNQRK